VKNTTNNVDLGRAALNVARVYRPEAFALLASRVENRPKGLTSEVSYICPAPDGSPACPVYPESRRELATAVEGVTLFLTGTPKRLEIAATHSKQTTELIPNRDKNTAPPRAIKRSSCSAGPGFVRHAFPSIMPHENRSDAIVIPGQISRHTPREITPVTYTKQTIAAPISRHKIGTPAIANFALVLTHDSTYDPAGTFTHV
jgi:hypothetical protein